MRIGQSVSDATVVQRLRDVLRVLNNGVSPIDNWYAKLLGPITTPATADTEFTVVHSLGRAPTNYIWNVDRAAIVYDSRRANWDQSQMFLKCNVASATVYLIVL
jgi:hypothetical protein